MSYPIPIGRVSKAKTNNLSLLADKAAHEILRINRSPLAVTVDPNGRVAVEPADNAIPEDLIGNYTGDRPWLPLAAQIERDLREHLRPRVV